MCILYLKTQQVEVPLRPIIDFLSAHSQSRSESGRREINKQKFGGATHVLKQEPCVIPKGDKIRVPWQRVLLLMVCFILTFIFFFIII